MKSLIWIILLTVCAVIIPGCSNNNITGDGNTIPANGEYVVFAWNDLGMHCLNPNYNKAVILPPYNTFWAQVVKRGNPPQIVTSGLTAEYKIINNTSSYNKRSYGQFWDNDVALFGIDLPQNKGLNLVNPSLHNGLSGQMVNMGDHFETDGAPVTPVDDSGTWSPYQVAEITILNANGDVVAKTQATIPTSDEMNCAKCHGADAFADILQKHDTLHQTSLASETPVLCASCHGSPALGSTDPGTSFLSAAIHASHADRGASCYDCHPGMNTSCNRSIAHTAADGNCTTCHGDMNQVASSISTGQRVPWVSEPKCATCHTNVSGVDTGQTLYRNAVGHGGIYCAGCHSSPHAMVPSIQSTDNYQALQYQEQASTIGNCGVCHSSSRGAGRSEFGEEHGGSNPERKTACHICHTAVPTLTANWPHSYQWKAR